MYDRVKLLAKIGNSFQLLTNFQKNSILDAWQSSDCTPEYKK